MHTINEESLVEFVFSHYHQSLKSSERAMRFLRSIGFDDPALVDELYLGFSDRTLGHQLPPDTSPTGAAARGTLRRLGLIRASGHEYLRGCVAFPLHDPAGRVIGAYAFQLKSYEKCRRLVPVSWVRYGRLQ